MNTPPATTERRAADHLDRALVRADVIVWSMDLPLQRMHFNAVGSKALGIPQTAAGISLLELRALTHPDDVPLLERANQQALAGHEVVAQLARYRLADGSWRHLLTRRVAERDANGTAVGLSGIAVDVSELLQQEKLRAEQANQEKSTFIARISHELRTPMNAVLGFSQLMREDPSQPLSSQQLQRLALIEQAGQRLLTLIDDLLDRVQRVDAPTTAPPAALESAHASARPDPGAAAATPTAPAAASGPGLRVLCVEDNPVNLILVREVLALRPQVRLRCAEDGLSGVAAALQEPPDVLLLDLQLPDISGHDVFARLRHQPQLSACRFIALSADAMPESVEAALASGFDDYWTKPIQFDRFLARIDEMVVQRAGSGWNR